MKRLIICIWIICTVGMLLATPQVPQVTASQRTDASKKVDIYYNLSHYMPVTITLQASNDNGLSWTLPITLVTGDIGESISPGNGKHIVWDVLAEHPDVIYENVRFKVTADDGQTPPVPQDFVFIPGGTFTMGRTTGSGGSDELPTHSVTLNSFYMGKYEVTQAEYAQYMQPSSSWSSNYGLGDNYPAYYVSWYAILKYCNLRSIAEGLTPVYTISGSTDPADWGSVPTSSNSTWNAAICDWSANGYRLPTEAEWEYAARGASNDPDYLYSGSDDIIYDMSGNVYEWCWDWYGSSYYSSSPSNNPTGPASGSYRVKRGGYWNGSALYCRVASRYGSIPGHSYYAFGFRLCRAVL